MRGGYRRRAAQRRNVYLSRNGHLGELGTVGDENDLIVQPSLAK
jgi:hypothetical protein